MWEGNEMKVIQLKVSDIMRIEAVDITPDSDMQVVAGNNANGKSSLLNAVVLAFLGKKGLEDTPDIVRHGADKGEIKVVTDDFTIIRRFTGKGGSSVEVRNNDGMKYPSPQAFLDGITSGIGFDPEEFAAMKPKERREQLMRIIELPFDYDKAMESRAKLFEERTMVGRESRALGSKSELIGEGRLEPVSGRELSEEYRKGMDANSEIVKAKEQMASWSDQVAQTKAQIDMLQQKLAAQTKAMDEENARIGSMEPVDLSGIQKRMAEIDDINREVERNRHIKAVNDSIDMKSAEYDALTEKLGEFDSNLDKALKNATGSLPVNGLGVTDSDVTYHGVPLGQCSSAEQIRVGLAVAAATNPKLRVVRIRNGALLDAASMKVVYDMAKERDLQVFVETIEVPDGFDGTAVVIEEGKVK
jgi:recombinational DNA repair ATPase RecF